MRILNLNDVSIKAVCSKFNLTPKNRIGRGTFATVHTASEKSVRKLTLDDSTMMFLRFFSDVPGLPRVIEDHGYVGEISTGDALYLIEMERLVPLAASDLEMRRLAGQVVKAARKIYSTANSTYGRGVSNVTVLEKSSLTTASALSRDRTLPKHVRDAFGRVYNFLDDYRDCGYGIDIHRGNLMARGKRLVLSDVVFNAEMLDKALRVTYARAFRGW